MKRTLRVLAWPLASNPHNPYTTILYGELTRRGVSVEEFTVPRLLMGRYDVWHMHWPERALRPHGLPVIPLLRCLALLHLMGIAHLRRKAIVWTAHNLHAHEAASPRLERWFWNRFVPRVDVVIHLSRYSLEAFKKKFPSGVALPRGFITPHGTFRGVYGPVLARAQARDRTGMPHDAFVFGFVGQIREYKGVLELVDAFRAYGAEDARLFIAGQPSSEKLAQSLREAASRDWRVHLRLERVPDAEMSTVLAASDLLVLPYTAVDNSGSALLGLSYERPVLAPALGALPELSEEVGKGWLQLYEGQLNPEVLARARAISQSLAGRPRLDRHDWTEVADIVLCAYRATSAHVNGLTTHPNGTSGRERQECGCE